MASIYLHYNNAAAGITDSNFVPNVSVPIINRRQLYMWEGTNIDKRREIITKAMADLLEIPGDLVSDLPRLTVTGRNDLYLVNHKGIIEYSTVRMRINLNRGYLEINGSDMEIQALMPDEMRISGDISSIKYMD